MRTPLVLLWVSFALGACGDREDRFEAGSEPKGPYAAGNILVYLDAPQERMLFVDAFTDPAQPSATSMDLPAGARYVMSLPDRKAIVIQNPDGGITVHYPEEGVKHDYALTAPFNKFAYAPEQALLACYFGGSVQLTGGQLVNKGQVAFVDLSKPGSVVEQVLPTYGGEPLGIDIAPTTGAKSLAVVRWVSFLSLVDARDPAFVPIAIPTKAPDSETDMYPGPIQFQATASQLRAWFLDSAQGDVYQLSIDLAKLGPGGEGVGINIFPTTQGATSFSPFTTGDGKTALLVISPYRAAVSVVYPDTSKVDIFDLEIQPSMVQVFPNGAQGNWALLSDPSHWTEAYYVAQLGKLTELKSKSFKKYALPAPASTLLPLDGGTRFLALHPKGMAGVLSVVTTMDGSAVTLGSMLETLQDWVYFEEQGLFFALLQQTTGAKSLLRIDTATMLQRSLALDGLSVNAIVDSQSPLWLLLTSSANSDLLMVPGDFESLDDTWLVTAPEWLGLAE